MVVTVRFGTMARGTRCRSNPTNETFKLRRLNLQTIGPGAYSLRTGDSPMNFSAGGFMRASEPVTLRGLAYFDGPSGSFVKMFNEVIPQ